MKPYEMPDYITLTDEELLEEISAEACGSVAGSCYGTSGCGCHYST